MAYWWVENAYDDLGGSARIYRLACQYGVSVPDVVRFMQPTLHDKLAPDTTVRMRASQHGNRARSFVVYGVHQ